MTSGGESFGQEYFASGGYEGLNTGPTGQYFWSRRFYALLVQRYCRERTVLEIGCGLGHLAQRLQDRYATFGIDISDYAVAAAHNTAPRANLRVLQAEDLASAFEPASFDAIVAVHVFEHFLNPPAILAQCARLLRSGGVLIFATPNLSAPLMQRKGRRWFGYTDPTHISLKKPAEWLGLVQAAGLRPERVFGDGMWDVPYVPLVPASLQLAFFGLPAAIQAMSGVPFIPARLSESLIVVARAGASVA